MILINITIAVTIFLLSSQPADVSGPMSRGVVYRIIEPILKTASYSTDEIFEISQILNGIARKMAHFGIYAIFGMSMYLLFSRYNIKAKYKFFVPVIICVIYAASDEIHQYFVPGRSCELRDVLIDSAGILSGILIICLIKSIKRKLKKV